MRASASLCGCLSCSCGTAGGASTPLRSFRPKKGATPRPEGLVRARGPACFHTRAPAPEGSLPVELSLAGRPSSAAEGAADQRAGPAPPGLDSCQPDTLPSRPHASTGARTGGAPIGSTLFATTCVRLCWVDDAAVYHNTLRLTRVQDSTSFRKCLPFMPVVSDAGTKSGRGAAVDRLISARHCCWPSTWFRSSHRRCSRLEAQPVFGPWHRR